MENECFLSIFLVCASYSYILIKIRFEFGSAYTYVWPRNDIEICDSSSH